ncbi:OPT family oligopeptide transporter [Aggregicoccus sp. 17bor-14]|uniref:OPT family oligopeptide transporter n=1 Tax=Myxococcaceae TaxID=31 RepID=UPI00129CD5C1|nr:MULTISPECIES: OPT family oligopeptide transporter [Myxococcaceae]MBF5044831.1 OPT/YSL family transporter [Simulacricoccus sp. 17bor-14]MRI90575.1 OPT family oligopeptide transporter [Aggregicoccus sp. 17bor-14]
MSLPAPSPAAPPPLPDVQGAPVDPKTDPERYWLQHVYQPGVRQLTGRAIVVGMLIGAVMCLSNLFIVLKTGWSFGVTITSSILAFALFGLLRKLKLVKREFGILENNAMASVASAAGYMTGGGNMAAVPALLLLTGALPSTAALIAWFAVVSLLGVFAALPIKRQLINIEQLPFPTGTATAEVLRSLYGHSKEAEEKSRLLWLSGAFSALMGFLTEAKARWMPFNLPSTFPLPFTLRGEALSKWTLGVGPSVILIGAGMLISFKTGWSMLLGAVLNYGVLAPAMVARGIIPKVSYSAIVGWTVWGGAALLVTAGLLQFAFQWRSVVKVLGGLGGLLLPRASKSAADPMAAVESPAAWFPLGFLVLGPVAVWLMSTLFQIPWWAGLLTLPLAFVMGIIAARVTGETDTTPTKALGPVTQLIYGGLLPGNLPANIMSANATAGVGLHSADLLTDLKSGFLLGANPRQQFYAQLFGVFAGALVIVPVFRLIVPNASVLGTEAFPAPSALVWAGVSRLMVQGVSALHPTAVTAAYIGAAAGVLLTLLERWAPRRLSPFIPSASGLGLAMVIPGTSSVALFLGAAIAAGMRRWTPGMAARALLPVSAGFIAGESLMGIAIKLLEVGGLFGFGAK